MSQLRTVVSASFARVRWATAVTIMLIALLSASTFQLGFDKKLVGTITEHEWGRYLFAIGATVTKMKYGIAGFVIDDPIEQKLQTGGLTDRREMLDALRMKFPDNIRDERLLQSSIDGAIELNVPAPPPGDYQRLRGSHGDDVGLVTFTGLAFSLFGATVPALYYTYFVVLWLAIVLFIIGHHRSSAAMICLTLLVLALFILVSSDLVNFSQEAPRYRGAAGSDIKDPRFFGTIAAIPALHLILTGIRRQGYKLSRLEYTALFLQALVFAFIVHVRWPTLWLLGSLYIYWIVALVVRPAAVFNLPKLTSAYSWVVAAVFPIIVTLGIITTSMAAHPLYKLEGDLLHHPFWHNLMTALEANPQWDDKYLASVNGARSDNMPTEIAKQEIAKLPSTERSAYLTRGGWPTPAAIMHFTRNRFMSILRSDPWFVIETFLIDQPTALFSSAIGFYVELVRFLVPSKLLMVGLTLIVAVCVGMTDPDALQVLWKVTGVALVLSLLALLPLLIATPPTQRVMIDHFLWFLFFLCLLSCSWGVYVASKFVPSVKGRVMD